MVSFEVRRVLYMSMRQGFQLEFNLSRAGATAFSNFLQGQILALFGSEAVRRRFVLTDLHKEIRDDPAHACVARVITAMEEERVEDMTHLTMVSVELEIILLSLRNTTGLLHTYPVPKNT